MKKFILIPALAFWNVVGTANAEEHSSRRPATAGGWNVDVGAGALLAPNYLGDDGYSVSSVPYIRVTHGDSFTASVQEGVRYNLINTDNFRAGPHVSIAFGRDEDGSGPFRIAGNKTNDLIGLGDIETSVSLGGFAEFDVGNMTASAKLGQAVSGHDGFTGQIGLSYKGVATGNGPPIIYAFGPQMNFGDTTFMSRFFGVSTSQAQTSGLAPFQASGGVVSYGLSGTAIIPVTRQVSVTFVGSFNRLTDDAAASSLVTERGSRDQAFFGLVTSYRLK